MDTPTKDEGTAPPEEPTPANRPIEMLSLAPEEIRDAVRRVDNVRASLEEMLELDPDADPDGAIEESTVRFIEAADEETALALATYVKTVLEPAELAIKLEIDRLQKRKGELVARADWAKGHLVSVLNKLGARRVQSATVFASLRKGSEYVAQTGDVDLDLLPDELVKRTAKPRLNDIKKLLKAGEVVEGYDLRRGAETVVIR